MFFFSRQASITWSGTVRCAFVAAPQFLGILNAGTLNIEIYESTSIVDYVPCEDISHKGLCTLPRRA